MVVLITGCRSGFGLLTALEAARRGHRVYAGVRELGHAADLMAQAGGLPITPIALEVTSAEDRAAAVAHILAEAGRIDVLVNNAGMAMGGFLEQLDEDELRRMFEVNVFGLWALTRAVLPTMRAQGSGLVVNVSSMAARQPLPGLGGYASTKFAVEGLSEVWRHELRPFGVRVVSIQPGPFKTDIFGRNRLMSRHAQDPGPYLEMVRHIDQRSADNVSRLAGDPQDVARLIVDRFDDPSPALRYVVGRLSWLRALMVWLLPQRVAEAVTARMVALPAPQRPGS